MKNLIVHAITLGIGLLLVWQVLDYPSQRTELTVTITKMSVHSRRYKYTSSQILYLWTSSYKFPFVYDPPLFGGAGEVKDQLKRGYAIRVIVDRDKLNFLKRRRDPEGPLELLQISRGQKVLFALSDYMVGYWAMLAVLGIVFLTMLVASLGALGLWRAAVPGEDTEMDQEEVWSREGSTRPWGSRLEQELAGAGGHARRSGDSSPELL